jgi:dihydroorotate dehydrogenase (fumarate)
MTRAIDLSTPYLGMRLRHPFVAGASPLAGDLDMARRLEDGGCAAIVMPSLFEEQITAANTGRIRHMDPLEEQFATVLSYFPGSNQYAFAPGEYVDQIERLKKTVDVPVIASLNGTTAEAWLTFSKQIEQAGADALELNMYEVVTDTARGSLAIERQLVELVREVKRMLRIPVAVKLSPYFTALANVACELDAAGADGLVLFNRFYQPDIDVAALTVTPRIELSTSAELLLRLRWLAILHGRVRATLAATGGVAVPVDGIKAILAGAHAVQMVSAILRHGPAYFAVMRDGLARWMESHELGAVADIRGALSLSSTPDANAFERANYLRSLASWPVAPRGAP